MENAVDALKIAFGVLVFVIALTVAFALLSQAKATSDIMLFASDKQITIHIVRMQMMQKEE